MWGLVIEILKPDLMTGEQVPVQQLEVADHMVGAGLVAEVDLSQSDPQKVHRH